jgi:hypothetical protein
VAVTVDAVGTEKFTASGTSASYTGITVGSGSNRALIALINFGHTSGPNDPSSITATWDSGGTNQAMTQLALFTPGSSGASGIWGLVAPTSGNKTLAVSWTTANESYIAGISFTGVDQTGGTTSFPNAATGSATSLTIPSAVGDIGVATSCSGIVLTTPTGTSIYNDSVNGTFVNTTAEYQAGGSPNITIGWAQIGSISACGVHASAGAGGFFARYYYDIGAQINV